MWTQFMDMHSGGRSKEPYEYIYIEADEVEARVIFYNRFHHNPERVTCTCCGDDYSINEYKTFEEASAYERHCFYDEGLKKYIEKPDKECSYKEYMTIDEYSKKDSVLAIPKDEIKEEERKGDVPQEGYTWI